jgi:hypothetical protein
MRRKTLCFVLLIVLFMLMPSAIGQASRQVVIHAGHVLEVKSGKMLSDQILLIEDGKIVGINSAAEAKVASDSVRIELPNATVLPGFMTRIRISQWTRNSVMKLWRFPRRGRH